jgi:hypothetical protein
MTRAKPNHCVKVDAEFKILLAFGRHWQVALNTGSSQEFVYENWFL